MNDHHSFLIYYHYYNIENIQISWRATHLILIEFPATICIPKDAPIKRIIFKLKFICIFKVTLLQEQQQYSNNPYH